MTDDEVTKAGNALVTDTEKIKECSEQMVKACSEEADKPDPEIDKCKSQVEQTPETDPSNVRKYGVGGQFDTETYRILFNGFLKDPTELNISCEKSVAQMNDEELTSWIYKLEEFVKVAKVAKQAARVTIEDRKLQMTEKQKATQLELDRKYKPATPKKAAPTKAKGASKAKLTEEQKKIKAAMDLLSLDEAGAILWLKAKGRL